jgi:hypothetical protein
MQPGAPTVPAAITCSICHSSFTDKQLLKLHLKQQGHYATLKIDQADVHKQQQVVRHYDTSQIDQADVQAPHAHGKQQQLVLAHDKKAAALIAHLVDTQLALLVPRLGPSPSTEAQSAACTHSTCVAGSDQSCFTGQATQAHCFLQEPATQGTSLRFSRLRLSPRLDRLGRHRHESEIVLTKKKEQYIINRTAIFASTKAGRWRQQSREVE